MSDKIVIDFESIGGRLWNRMYVVGDILDSKIVEVLKEQRFEQVAVYKWRLLVPSFLVEWRVLRLKKGLQAVVCHGSMEFSTLSKGVVKCSPGRVVV